MIEYLEINVLDTIVWEARRHWYRSAVTDMSLKDFEKKYGVAIPKVLLSGKRVAKAVLKQFDKEERVLEATIYGTDGERIETLIFERKHDIQSALNSLKKWLESHPLQAQ